MTVLGLTPGTCNKNLDLSGLSFVDRAGVELLQQLLRQGVRIHSCSPFVAELLHWDHNPKP
jgi:hypothetical protein